MPVVKRQVTFPEISDGFLNAEELSDYLPDPGKKMTVMDYDRNWYRGRMHSKQPRVLGLEKLFRKFNVKAGDNITLDISSSDPGLLHVHFENNKGDELGAVYRQDPLIVVSFESIFEDHIASNLTDVEPGLKLFKDMDGISGRQYLTDVGIIDFLCLDEEGNYIVVEFMRGNDSNKMIGQISRHLGWVKKNLAGEVRDVRGVIVMHRPTEVYPENEKLVYAVEANPKLKIKYYEITVKFESEDE